MRLSLISLALAALAAACSSVPGPHHGIESARGVLLAVRSQPNLTDDARLELARAEQALTAAEAAYRRGKKKERAMVEHLAYIAHQRALLAKERAELTRAEDALDVARNESRALIDTRNRMPLSGRSGAQAEALPPGAAAAPGRVAESVPVPPPGNPDIARAPLDPPRQIGGPAADTPAAVTPAPAQPLAAAPSPAPPSAQTAAPSPAPPSAQAAAPSSVPPNARATAPVPVPPGAQATAPPSDGRDARPTRDAVPGAADRSPADRTVAPPRASAPAPSVAMAGAPPVPVGNARAGSESARRAADNAAAKAPEKASNKSGKSDPRKTDARKVEPRKAEPARSAGAPAKSERERTAAAPRPDGKGGAKAGATDKAADKATAAAPPAKPTPANDGTVVAKAPPRSEPDAAKTPPRSEREAAAAPPRPAPEAADARAAAGAPVVPGAKQTPRGTVITLGDDQFNLHQAYLRAGATRALDPLAEFLRQHPERRIRIAGFTDNTASESENQRLSLERANEVRKALIRRGVASDRMQTVGHGAAEPIARNDTPAGREQNRRVEIVVSDERGNLARR